MTFADDALDREIFALRAAVAPRPRLDWDDVIARASRPRRRERAPWVYAAACAAASFVGLASLHDSKATSAAVLPGESMSYFDGLSCREGVADPAVTTEPPMCVAPMKLVCERDVTSDPPAP
ncbi:MAG TPA: hypothetical protein VGH28_17300 [Polyangiaceae bacterium]|jgi:hypothetical protein